jgi:hypothetical protein
VASLSAVALGMGLGRVFLGSPVWGDLPPSKESKTTAWTTAVAWVADAAGVEVVDVVVPCVPAAAAVLVADPLPLAAVPAGAVVLAAAAAGVDGVAVEPGAGVEVAEAPFDAELVCTLDDELAAVATAAVAVAGGLVVVAADCDTDVAAEPLAVAAATVAVGADDAADGAEVEVGAAAVGGTAVGGTAVGGTAVGGTAVGGAAVGATYAGAAAVDCGSAEKAFCATAGPNANATAATSANAEYRRDRAGTKHTASTNRARQDGSGRPVGRVGECPRIVREPLRIASTLVRPGSGVVE